MRSNALKVVFLLLALSIPAALRAQAKLYRFATAALLALMLACGFAMAQTSQGTITGTVRDASGAVIAHANVTLTNEATGVARQTTTNGEGAFRADAVEPGPYTVHVAVAGFEAYVLQHLDVQPSVITSYDVTLQVASTKSEITVQAANSATLDLASGELATTINNSELQSVPIMSLNPVELAETLPGVQMLNNGGLSNGVDISINGSRPRANNYLIDGQDDNDNNIAGQALQANIPDMYSSVSVLTNSYSAEYGRAGGGVVNLVTKSGTNTPHGSAWDLYSGSGLNAVDGQNRGTGFNKARYDQHQYGFAAGVPIIRDRLWAFGASQWSRYYGKATPANIGLPTDQDAVTLDDGTTTSSYAYLQNLGTTNANAALLMKYLGSLSQYNLIARSGSDVTLVDEPNCTSCTLHFYTYKRPNQAQQETDTQWTAKIDYQVTTKDHISGRFLHDYDFLSPDWFNFPSQLPGFDSYQGGPAEQGAADYTHIFSPNAINEFRASLTRINFEFALLPSTIANPLSSQPVINIANTGLPQLGPQSTSLPQGRGHDSYQFQDTVTRTFGRQTLRIGADVSRVLVRDFVPFNNYGALDFTKSSGYSALNNFLDNYLGASGTATISFGSPRVDSHQWQTAYFVQDDVKFRPDLTVNLGLRYEFQTNPENAVKYPAINPDTVLADPITAYYKVAEDYNNFGPRIGLAWNPHTSTPFLGDGKTVYHAGFGVFYDVLFTNITDNTQETAPNVQSPEVQVTTGRGAGNATQLIPAMKPSATISPFNSVESAVNNLVNPETYQWNLGFERQMPGQVKLTANYVGSRGEKLFANQQYNYFVNGSRINPDRGPIVARGNFADSDYNGLELGVTHDFRHGLFLQASYTYSKNLDDGSEVFSFTGAPTSYTANLAPGHRGQDWGPSVYDHRNYLTLTYAWQIPSIPQVNNGFANEAIDIVTRKWQFSGVSFWQSGEYTSFNLSGFDFNGDGSSANDRPLLGNGKAGLETIGMDGYVLGCTDAPGEGYFDYGAADATGACNQVDLSQVHWVVPYPYSPGQVAQEIGRNSFSNPGYWNENWALQKSFPLHAPRLENGALQLRAEAENVFNHNNVGLLDTDLLDAAPGPGDPFMNRNTARFDDERQLRFWMKFVF